MRGEVWGRGGESEDRLRWGLMPPSSVSRPLHYSLPFPPLTPPQDGGGLFKDFLESLVKEGFNSERGLFVASAANQLYPNPAGAGGGGLRPRPHSLRLLFTCFLL